MRLLRGPAASIAMRMGKRLTGEALRQHCDDFTDGELDSWELTKLCEYVEEHPAYKALPEAEEAVPGVPGE